MDNHTSDDQPLIVFVAIQARKAIWYHPAKDLMDREPLVFTFIDHGNGRVPCGEYCAIQFRPDRRKRRAHSLAKAGLQPYVHDRKAA